MKVSYKWKLEQKYINLPKCKNTYQKIKRELTK